MILPVLVLGGGRYLTMTGDVVPARRTFTAEEIELSRSLDPDWDAEIEAAPGDGVLLTDDRREFWDDCARAGGHTLDELLAVNLDA